MFALIIGIDIYASGGIKPLSGAVADARAVGGYLRDKLEVPQDHITILENEHASRAGIIKGLEGLMDDHRIQRGDPIVIFYAGHGSEALAPRGWEAGGTDSTIQLVLPYDVYCRLGEEVVAPIPDRTFGALIDAIAQKKGDNIVVIMDSCHSASGTRSLGDSYDTVRSEALPPNYQLPENLDRNIWSFFPTNSGLRSHVLLTACSSSGVAWESKKRGIFTVALLELFDVTPPSNLRYCDIPMRICVGSGQNPHCEGFNRERYIFTSTLPSSPVEFFIPVFTRIKKGGDHAYILDGGSAHGLVVGDEFVIYHDIDCSETGGTLVLDELGTYHSIMRPAGQKPQIGTNSVAVRKGGNRPSLRIFSHPEDKTYEILSRVNDQDLSSIVLVGTSDDAQIVISSDEDQALVRLRSRGARHVDFCIGPTNELQRILKASLHFFSELCRTADSAEITDHVQVEIHELQTSQHQFPDAPTVELLPRNPVLCKDGHFTLRQQVPYGIKLTNKSTHDLYVIVQYFDPKNEFPFYTLFRPACSRSKLDVPLKKSGGSLAVGYGSGGSPPFVISSLDKKGLGFLKISLLTRPLDAFYEDEAFHLAKYLPDNLKGPWATIVKPVKHCSFPARQHTPRQQAATKVYKIDQPPCPPVKPTVERSSVPYKGKNKSVSPSDSDSPPKIRKQPGYLSRFWRNSKIFLAQIFASHTRQALPPPTENK